MRKIFILIIFSTLTILFTWTGYKSAAQTQRSKNNPMMSCGREAYKDKFAVFIGDEESEKLIDPDSIMGEIDDLELTYKKHLVELPLVSYDYYYGKHINASAAANEINQVRILRPGERVSLIGNGYLTMSRSRGYISPGYGFMYASGVCWTTSSLGSMMDEVNKAFNRKYDKPLFIFNFGDRSPHPHSYATYRNSNSGYGYAVVKVPGAYSSDYSFTINPNLSNDPEFEDLKLKIVMIASTNHESAYLGQSIGAYLKANIDF